MSHCRIAIIGPGKIARDQHVPAISGHSAFSLVASVGPEENGFEGVPHFATLGDLLNGGPAVDAVAICTPPQVRYGLAKDAIAAGLHVMLEKPPAATLSQVDALEHLARRQGVSLFATWHSRFASGVEPARQWLSGREVTRATITWLEDVRQWHPGQAWIWQPGGLGVFDPGINALSIATQILPLPLTLSEAVLAYPSNREAPIAAALLLHDAGGTEVAARMDWRQKGPPTWDITVDTTEGSLTLSEGGSVLQLPEGTQRFQDEEYPALYERFATLVASGSSDVDCLPFRLVADAFMLGRRDTTEPFED